MNEQIEQMHSEAVRLQFLAKSAIHDAEHCNDLARQKTMLEDALKNIDSAIMFADMGIELSKEPEKISHCE